MQGLSSDIVEQETRTGSENTGDSDKASSSTNHSVPIIPKSSLREVLESGLDESDMWRTSSPKQNRSQAQATSMSNPPHPESFNHGSDGIGNELQRASTSEAPVPANATEGTEHRTQDVQGQL